MMMWTLRAHPDWRRRELRTSGEEPEADQTRESTTESGSTER